MALSEDQLTTLLELLEKTHGLDPSSDAFLKIERAVAHLEKSAKKKRRLARKRASAREDAQALRGNTGGTLNRDRTCYVCKRPYRELHEWLPQLCPACGERSYTLRNQPLSLPGRRALVTGARVKIGYATALKLLRAGAEVHVTSRFPRDAMRRYAGEHDAKAWLERLHVHGLDFRNLGQLLSALQVWKQGPAFDILINNAAQSVWHQPAYFESLHAGERAETDEPVHEYVGGSSLAPLVPSGALQTLDLKRADSWVQTLGEISPVDMVEVQVVNAIAPYFICSELRENLKRSSFQDRYIVNVSALEGQFSKVDKMTRHPHTNMAKAGLNMLTRTSANDLVEDRIFMTSVDPGWMSQEGAKVDPDFKPPLTAEDCAARVLHPIAQGLAGIPLFGVLLKDFEVIPW